jgi:hypothetical protein
VRRGGDSGAGGVGLCPYVVGAAARFGGWYVIVGPLVDVCCPRVIPQRKAAWARLWMIGVDHRPIV